MSNKRRVAEKNLGLFLSPSSAGGEGGYLIPMDNLNVGPGEPGPGDEWHMPAAPPDEVVARDESSVEQVNSDGTVSPPPRVTRKS